MRKEEIEMIDEVMAGLNRNVIGAIYIDYPVYLIHLEYQKKNDDPMYFIDWAITHFIKSQPKLDKMSVAKIIGMDIQLINYRIKLLKDEGLIKEDAKGFNITTVGEQTFFNEIDEVPYINDSTDFLIDGKSLTTMPPIFYEDKGYIRFDENSIYPRSILKGANDQPVVNLLKKIEKMSNDKKRSVGLPAESKNFKSIDMPSQGLLRMYLVFSSDQKGKNYKDVVYGKKIVEIPAINEMVSKSYFSDDLQFNYGYDNLDVIELKDKVLNLSSKGIKSFLGYTFYWKEVSEKWYLYGNKSAIRPLTVNLNIDNFIASGNPRELIACLKRGYREFDSDEMFVRVTVKSIDKKLLKLIELDQCIENSKKTKNLSDIDDIYSEYGINYVRRSLITLNRFDCLEDIDNSKYIKEEC